MRVSERAGKKEMQRGRERRGVSGKGERKGEGERGRAERETA